MAITDVQRKAVIALFEGVTAQHHETVDQKVAAIVGPRTSRTYCTDGRANRQCPSGFEYRTKIVVKHDDGTAETIYGWWSCFNPGYPACEGEG
jgi:hypothetical protein